MTRFYMVCQTLFKKALYSIAIYEHKQRQRPYH